MSVTNAISGIIIGGMLQISGPLSSPTTIRRDRHPPRTINISGGFLVSQRMLKMFQSEESMSNNLLSVAYVAASAIHSQPGESVQSGNRSQR